MTEKKRTEFVRVLRAPSWLNLSEIRNLLGPEWSRSGMRRHRRNGREGKGVLHLPHGKVAYFTPALLKSSGPGSVPRRSQVSC
jgi:hypothetical protein